MDESEKIIEAVRSREMLWNLCNRNYKNVKMKAKEWKNISEELNLPFEHVKKKWRSLRDTYLRNVNKSKVSGQAADDVEPVGRYSMQMEFLRDHVKPRTTMGNYIEERQQRLTTPTPTAMTPVVLMDPGSPVFDDLEEEETLPSCSTPLASTNASSSASASAPKRRRTGTSMSTVEQTFMSTLNCMKEYIARPKVDTTVVQSSEDELFCRSMIQKISKFPLEVRNSTKLELLRFVNQVEMDLVNEGALNV